MQISEAKLFKKLCDLFPEEKIERHGRPYWVELQHLDIYFSNRNINIEYQGIQHQKSVEYFNGEEGFEYTKERDERKRKKV